MARPDQYSYIGGSKACAVMGCHPKVTTLDLFLEYTGLRPEIVNVGMNMEWGLSLEPWLAEQFCQRHGHTVERAGFQRHPEYDFIAGHADFYLTDAAELLETKTTTTERYDEYLPPYVAWQCQHYMLVTGCNACHVFIAVLHRTEFIYYRVDADPSLQKQMIKKYSEFWECVQTATPPKPQTASDFGRLHLEPNEETIIATESQESLLSRLLEVKSEVEVLTEEKRSLEEELKWSLGDAQRVEFEDHIAVWTPVRSRRFNAGLFKEENPEIYDSYIEPSGYRRFQIRNKKRKDVREDTNTVA